MKNVVITILVVLVLGLGGYLVYDKGIDKKEVKCNCTSNEETKCENVTEEENKDFSINILSIDDASIAVEGPNEHIWVKGKMKLSFKANDYIAVLLSGYCIGENGEKYAMHGPGSGAIGFHDGDTEFELVENIPQNVLYNDGSEKSIDSVDWNSVNIKSCKVEKLIAYTTESGGFESIEKELNYEKSF